MGSVRDRLLAKAKVRTEEVRIEEDVFVVREVDADTFAEYGKIVTEKALEANALMLRACLIGEDGLPDPEFTLAEALEVAKSARLCTPLMSAIMRLSGYGKKETDAT